MRYKNICDTHTHSSNSFDAQDSVLDMCKRAAELSLSAIAITDHCECNFYGEPHEVFGDFKAQIRQSAIDTAEARDRFGGTLKVLRGIELGEPAQNRKAVDEILNTYEYDFILASIHSIEGYEDFYYLKYSCDNVHILLKKYFDEMLDMIKTCDFDSLAHITYPLRYIVGRHGMNIDMRRYSSEIDGILESLVKADRALEINTSGLRQEIGCTMPPADIVKRFHSMGGKYITVGSDAHNCNDLASGIEQGMRIAYDSGFRKTAIYENRSPILVDIE